MSTEETYTMSSCQPYDRGRITIRDDIRDAIDVTLPSHVTIRLPEYDEKFDVRVDTAGRFYIPASVRDRYGIEDGDYVDVEVVE